MKRHVNIPIFIPHLGCPNQCVFCNQRTISGTAEFNPDSVTAIIEEALSTVKSDVECEIAFFGGSFTGIDRNLMERLLIIANSYIKQGRVSTIRCSTRPDYINNDILDILYKYGVRTIELGLQSINDRVLDACRRGHDFRDEVAACRAIVAHGFTLGGQMMIGLPGATSEDELATAEFIALSGAKEARIYPTVVFRDTELCDMTKAGEYAPLSVDEAVVRSAAALAVFVKSGIKVLRIGLCDSENLHADKTYFAGPNHAALGELVEGELYYSLIRAELNSCKTDGSTKICIDCPRGHMSKVIGQNKRNKLRLIEEFSLCGFTVREDDTLDGYNYRLSLKQKEDVQCI